MKRDCKEGETVIRRKFCPVPIRETIRNSFFITSSSFPLTLFPFTLIIVIVQVASEKPTLDSCIQVTQLASVVLLCGSMRAQIKWENRARCYNLNQMGIFRPRIGEERIKGFKSKACIHKNLSVGTKAFEWWPVSVIQLYFAFFF